MYLLGMIDYLSKINDLPMCTNYNDIRRQYKNDLSDVAGSVEKRRSISKKVFYIKVSCAVRTCVIR